MYFQVERELESAGTWKHHWDILHHLCNSVPASARYQLELKERIQDLKDTLKSKAEVFLNRLELDREGRKVDLRVTLHK
jgi:hypothetical protein